METRICGIYGEIFFCYILKRVKNHNRHNCLISKVEGTPGKPYGGLLAHFNVVEANMSNRRLDVAKLLQENEVAMCITSFPMLGM